jgi:uncharacterized membrane protein HdeD (DUF308 family)
MSEALFSHTLLHDRIQSASHRLLWVGIVMLVLGVAAIVWPAFSTLVATLFVGWMLFLSGCIALFGSFTIRGTGPFFSALLFALLSIAAGVFLLFNPLAGETALTLAMVAIFAVQGAFEIFLALDVRPLRGWVPMLISGVITIVVAVLIAAEWPGISLFLLGVLVGVNFISTGIGYISISRVLKPSA